MLDSMLYVFDSVAIKDFGRITGRSSVEFSTLYEYIRDAVMLILTATGIWLAIRPRERGVYRVEASTEVKGKAIEDFYGRNWPEFLNEDGEALYQALGKCEPIGLQVKPIPIPAVGALPLSKLFERTKREIPEQWLLSKLPPTKTNCGSSGPLLVRP